MSLRKKRKWLALPLAAALPLALACGPREETMLEPETGTEDQVAPPTMDPIEEPVVPEEDDREGFDEPPGFDEPEGSGESR